MKLNMTSQKTVASEGLKMTRMGVEAKSMDLIISYLRDKIYTDKILAPIREYTCNAMDAMVEAGNTTDSVEVSLKKVGEAWMWAVRDYGNGLNDDDITDIFGCYGASRKRHSNDQIGSYGIGSGAGFAYGDSFYVNSYHNGTKSSYVCTLGKGENGVSVGEIYRVSQEPTNETGIEVSLEVKPYEVDTFHKKTKNIVEWFPVGSRITYSYTSAYDLKGSLYAPLAVEHVETYGDYTFNRYDTDGGGNNNYSVRMGGVVYPAYSKFRRNRNFSKFVVVDVPIGKLTIPISREGIENTPLNDKVFEEIEKHFDTIFENERGNISVPKLGTLVSGKESMNRQHLGDWFNYNFRESFPKTYSEYYSFGRKKNIDDNGSYEVADTNGKYLVYILPVIKNLNNWHKRLIQSLKKIQGVDYNGYIYILKSSYLDLMAKLDNSIDISDLVFVDVKTLKLPKLEREVVDDKSYLVYDNYGYKKFYTADELDKEVTSKHFKGEDPEDDWYLEAKDMAHINLRTIGKVSDFGTRSVFRTTNSIKMIESLVELGWLTPDSQEYIDNKKKFDDIYRFERIKESAKHSLKELYYGAGTSTRLVNIIQKTPQKIDRIKKVQKMILEEQSTRARILKSMRDYNQHIKREDLRKILMLKD